jgi:hypothetical protein
MTTADPKAPLPECTYSGVDLARPCGDKTIRVVTMTLDKYEELRAHIAALDAENKRLREEVKQKTSALWFIENGGAEGVSNSEMVCLMRQEARAGLG